MIPDITVISMKKKPIDGEKTLSVETSNEESEYSYWDVKSF